MGSNNKCVFQIKGFPDETAAQLKRETLHFTEVLRHEIEGGEVSLEVEIIHGNSTAPSISFLPSGNQQIDGWQVFILNSISGLAYLPGTNYYKPDQYAVSCTFKQSAPIAP